MLKCHFSVSYNDYGYLCLYLFQINKQMRQSTPDLILHIIHLLRVTVYLIVVLYLEYLCSEKCLFHSCNLYWIKVSKSLRHAVIAYS